MTDHVDLVIVGGGIGGGALATVLAGAGASVLVLEKSTVYRDQVRGEWIAPTVKPPRGGSKRGLFATRAPNRPSQIGLTNVAVKEVDVAEGRVRVQGIDLLDETPLLDIKPYLPNVDAWPDAGHGWLEPYLEAGIEPRLKKPLRPMAKA